MLSIFCGDNSVASRDAFAIAKTKASKEGSFISEYDPADLLDIAKSGGSNAWDLFAGKPVYTTTNLVKTIKKKFARKAKDELRKLAADANIEIIDWEESSAYDLGIDKDKFSFVHDFKLSVSTFTLLPKFKTKNASVFLCELHELTKSQPIVVTIAMLMRHVRSMLMIKSGKSVRDNPYLVRLAQASAASFTKEQVLEIYKRLLKADINSKTGRNTPLSNKEQLEMLTGFLLN
ncbi:MAG: hypothetical protein U0525_05550 [Patescibacteria group bacterium]